MKNVLLLDLDGVLITTPPWKPDQMHEDGYSDFKKSAVENINILFEKVSFEIWLTSSRRANKTLAEFNEIFCNRKLSNKLVGFLPVETIKCTRLIEINKFLDKEVLDNFLIIDDDNSLNDLAPERKKFWVKTDSLIGFNKEKLDMASEIIKNWNY
jgi:hypothetical protein